MALDFPNSPVPVEGQLYVGNNGVTYVYTGGKWVGQGATGNITSTTNSLYSGSFVVNLDTAGNLNIPADGDVVRSGVAIFDAVATLQANSSGEDVAAANVQIGLLWTNAAAQATAINTINANVAAANLSVAALNANIGNLVNNAPAALDTLYEIANSLGNSASLSTTLMTAISGVRANVNAANLEIASTNANLTSFGTYANTTFTGGGGSTYGNANVASYLTAFDGNILPSSNVTYSLGDATHQWRDLWVSNNTIYIGNVPLTVSNGNLLVNGSLVTSSGSGTDDVLRANVGAYQTFANSNAATQATSINTINANVGAYQTFANSNAATQSTAIATLQTQVYANANVNTYLSSSIIGSLSTSGNLTVGGNLVVNGNSTIINTTTYTIEDNILQIADGNPADTLDLGFVGHRTVASTLQHTGLVRDASAGNWRLFSNVTAQPGTTIDFTNAVYDDLVVGNISANIVKNGYTWVFGTDGKLTVPANGIITAPINQEFQLQARDTNSVLRNEINLDPNNGTYMSVWRDGTTSFSSAAGSWATASWNNEEGLGAARFTDAQALQDFWTTGIGSIEGVAIEASINGGARTPNVFYDGNNGETYGVYLGLDAVPPGGQGTTVPITSLVFYYRLQSKINMDVTGGGEILLDAQAMDIDLRTTLNLDLRAGENLNLRGLGAYPVRIYTNNSTHMWEFDTSGSLTLPSEGKINGIGAPNDRYGYISWDGNSSGDGSGYNTMRLVPDLQGLEDVDTYIILDPAYDGQTGNIHIRAGGTRDNSLANLYLGGANSHVKIGAGVNPPVTVKANNNSWTFGNTGTTTFPTGVTLSNARGANTVNFLTGVDKSFQIETQTSATSKLWNFTTDGNLTLPQNANINFANGVSILAGITGTYGNANVAAYLPTYTGNIAGNIVKNGNVWTFGTNGTTTFPTNISINYSGGNVQFPRIIADSGKAFSIQGQGNIGSAALSWTVNPDAAGQYAAVAVTKGGGDNLAKVLLSAQSDSGDAATAKTWVFNQTGTTRFPDGIILAPAGQNITMQSDQYSQLMWENANLTVAPDMAINSNFYVAQNNATLDIGYRDGSSTQIIKSWYWNADGTLTLPTAGRINFDYLSISSDANVSAFYAPGGNVKLDAGTGNAQIVANSLNDSKTWTFGTDGATTLPGDIYSGTGAAIKFSKGLEGDVDGAHLQVSNITFLPNVAFEDIPGLNLGLAMAPAIGWTMQSMINSWTANGAVNVSSSTLAAPYSDSGNIGTIALGGPSGTGSIVWAGETDRYALSGNTLAYEPYGNIKGLTVGSSANVIITSNVGPVESFRWIFGANANLTLPETGYLRVGSGIVAGFASSPAPVISGFSSISAENFRFQGNGVNILSAVGAGSYGNTQVATYLSNYNGDINFTSSTAIISNVDVITVGAHIQSPAYQFSNGTSILAGITGTYSNTNVAAYLTTANISTTGNITAGNVSAVNFVGTIQAQVGSSFAYATDAYGSLFNTGGVPLPADTNSNAIVAGYTIVGNSGAVTLTVTSATFIPGTPNIVQVATTPTASSLAYPVTVYSANYSPAIPVSTITVGNATVSGNVIAPNYLFANGVSIFTGITGTYSNTNVAAYLTTANISTTGNITAGNVSATRYNFANGVSILSNVVTKTTGTWNVTTGTNTYSFTVPNSGTYQLWVDCNIPNGILAYNATATVTNSNVPVVGAQYAWVYDGGGTPIDFTSIPNQFTGTANTIVRSSVAPSATTNRFDFGINNTSGGNVTVRYGWIAIS
jgi:hypothetical protein